MDIAVQTDFSVAAEQDDIHATVNYESIFRIVKEEMDEPSRLLETVAKKIIDHVMEAFPTVDLVELKISKLNPPIGGKCDRSSLTVSMRR